MPPPSQNYSQRRTGYNSRYDEDGYRRDGRRKIEGYKQSQGPVRTYGGLNEYYALQDRNNRAFADPRFPGKSAGEISQNAQATNKRINRSGQAEDAYQNRFRRSTSREENVAAAKRSGAFAKLRREYNKANPAKRMDREGNITDRNPSPASGSAPPMPTPTGVIRPPAPKSKFAAVTPRQMYKDAASQRSIIARDNGEAGVTSAYGFGRYNPPKVVDGVTLPKPEATVEDDFGNIVPMKDYAQRRKYVQSTQVGYKPSRRA